MSFLNKVFANLSRKKITAQELDLSDIPKNWEVQPLKPGQKAKDKATCGECGLSWDDGISTSMTPSPSARCPFENFHNYDDDEEEIEEEEDSSDEDDAFLTPTGPLGSKTSVSVGGKHLGNFNSDEEAEEALVKWIIKNKFWPNTWYVSDHGNETRYKFKLTNHDRINKAFGSEK